MQTRYAQSYLVPGPGPLLRGVVVGERLPSLEDWVLPATLFALVLVTNARSQELVGK